MSVEGVSVRFFVAAGRALGRQHGERLVGPDGLAERLRAALAEAERIYLAMPLAPKRERKKLKTP